MRTLVSMSLGVKIDVPPGVIINSFEWKLDCFSKACTGEFVSPKNSIAEIEKAWKDFSEKERELLDAESLFLRWHLLRVFKWWWPDWVAERRHQLVLEMNHRSVRLRGNLMRGRIRRPPHENPKTIVVSR